MEETSGVTASILGAPSGDGGLRSLGERFQPDLLRGTGGYEVPLSVPAGPGEVRPELSLQYSTGLGNGPYGMGWQLNGLIEIRRRVDAGVPTYDGTDEFQLADGDVLVRVDEGRYRSRVDTRNYDVQRLDADGTPADDGVGGWRVRTKEGMNFELGTTPDSRVEHDGQVFAWLLTRQTGPRGAPVEFTYEGDGAVRYLRSVSWGGFGLRFRYETRPDVLCDGRAGFDRTIDRRCRSIEMMREEDPEPVSAYDLTYEEAAATRLSLLTEIGHIGYAPDGTAESHPPVRFTYSTFDPNGATYRRIGDRRDLPALEGPETALVDMTGDGLPDILETDADGHRYSPNLGDGRFGGPKPLPSAPAGMTLGRPGVSFADLNGDGTADLLQTGSRLTMAVANTGAGAWAERPRVQRDQLPLSLTATSTRLVDLDGDGRVDLLQSGSEGLLMAYNDGDGRWSGLRAVRRRSEGSTGRDADAAVPDVALDDDGVHVADMTGDGLADVVTVENGRVAYWPSRGRDRWGERVVMKRSPRFPRPFDHRRLFVSDVDGDGTADLVYVEYDRVSVWFNRTGFAWSDRIEIPFVPPPTVESAILVDLYGTGTRGLLWSDTRRRDARSTYRFLDFTDGRKPYLLESVDNGFGLTTTVTYEPTTANRPLGGELEGSPPYLPFSAHVVRTIEETDRVADRTRRTNLEFERGYYDPEFREFRGFERATVTAEGDDHTPTVIQETIFALGARQAPLRDAPTSAEVRARERALAGVPAEVHTYEIRDGERVLLEAATTEWNLRTEFADEERFVHVPRMVRGESRDADPDGPDRIETTTYEYDEYDNLAARRRTRRFADQSESDALVTEERFSYTENESSWLVGLPVSIEERDTDGRLRRHVRHFYDGLDFQGLPAGQATRGRLRRTRELYLADWALPAEYDDEIEPDWGLVHEEEGYYRDTAAFAHDPSGNVVGIRDSFDAEWTVEYDADELFPVRLTGPDGGSTEATFDERLAGPISIRTQDGTETRYEYTPLGRLRAQYDTTGDGDVELSRILLARELDVSTDGPIPAHLVSVRPHAPGRSVAEIIGDGVDENDLRSDLDVEAIIAASVVVEYYDAEGAPLQQVRRVNDGPNGDARWMVARRRSYATRGEPAAEYPNVLVEDSGYRPELSTDTAVTFEYAHDGALRQLTLADGRRLLASHHPSHVERWTPTQADDDPPRVERLDARGNLVGIEQPDGADDVFTTDYEVEADGRPTTVRDATGRLLATYTYAGPGPAVRIDHADAGARTYWYDADERLRLRIDDLGRRLEYDYDAGGRPTTVRDATDQSNPVTIRDLRYADGRLVSAREEDVTTDYDHDAVGRVVRETVSYADGESLTLEHEYGYAGELRAVVTPDGHRTAYEYGVGGIASSIPGIVDAIITDVSDAPTELDFAGAPTVSYEYDSHTRELAGAKLTTRSVHRQIEYAYDPDGNVAEIHDQLPGGTLFRTFEYDARSQLIRAVTRRGETTGEVVRDDRYAYSASGGLTRNDESFAEPATGDPDHAGRPVEVQFLDDETPTAIEYDEIGRTVTIGDRILRYDAFDRLVEATTEDGTTVSFVYDHRGNRVEKRVGDARTRTLGPFETGPDGTRHIVSLGDLPLAERRTTSEGETTTLALLCDGLGSTLTACALDESVVNHQTYSPYGLVETDMDLGVVDDDDARFVGRRPDAELGLVQYGDRYYAQRLGRFLTPDWFVIERPELAMRQPIAFNVYAYAGNNPLTYRDPSGRFLVTALIAVGAAFVVGFVAGAVVGATSGRGVGGSLLMGLETGLLFAAGMALGAVTGGLAGVVIGGLVGAATGGLVGALTFGATGLLVGGVVGGVIGGLNGLIGGLTENYSRDLLGVLAFALDSSWGLVGTGLGLVFHGMNLFYGDADYNWNLSRRQNRHVYDGGFAFGSGYATTQGNVISRLRGRHGELLNHETLHVWQGRAFGPIYQTVYVGWFVVGGAIGAIVGIGTEIAGTQSWGDTFLDFAYHSNPFEIWAYYQEGPFPTGPGERGDFSLV